MADNLLKSGATPEGVADKLQLPDDSLIEARNMHGSTKTRAKSGSKELDQRRADLVETMKELQGQQSTLPRRIQLP